MDSSAAHTQLLRQLLAGDAFALAAESAARSACFVAEAIVFLLCEV